MKKIVGLMALLLFSAAPAFAAEHCQCDASCRKACAEGKADACGCKHCDCKDCQCDAKKEQGK